MTTPEVLGRALAASPDPELARIAIARVGEHPEAREALATAPVEAALLLGFSSAAADFLAANPAEAALLADAAPRSRDELEAEAAADARRLGPAPGLRRFRRRALYRTAVRDLSGASVEDVVAEVTWIAEACLRVAAAESGLAAVSVIAMGKLGAEELNYASDVDVLFVHADGADPAGAARAAGRFIALLSEPTAEGVALRVDASLRPEGRAGALSRSLASSLEYYRRHAATWERQALLKARPVAGDLALGERLLTELQPIVYPERLEPSAVADVRAMKGRIEEIVRAGGKQDVEVKRGRGGIRDVEFAVQLLQLVHGRRDPALRRRGTLLALEALAAGAYVAGDDAAALADAYRFLRRLEHRLQIARDLQTHELPADEESLRRLARAMGFGSSRRLRDGYARETGIVREVHERLFYRPLLEAFTGSTPSVRRDRPATEELLAGLGFAHPGRAYERLARLVEPARETGNAVEATFPLLAPELAVAPDPDAALVRLERILDGPGGAEIGRLLARDPAPARRLARACGASAWLAAELAARAGAAGLLVAPAGEAGPDDPAAALVGAGIAAAAGDLEVPELGRAIASVADGAVGRAVGAAAPRVPLAVIGLGKLGGEELNLASDLDVVFVFDAEGAGGFEEAERAAEAVLAAVRDLGFEPDADLRPEGRNGPLARSMAAWLEYWQRWGKTWELQSLLKARHVAGDAALGRRFLSAASDFAYPDGLTIDRVAEIRRMRVRMETERVRPADARRFHFKLGYGGLADVQFAVELQMMRYGREHEGLRRRHTLEALEALAEQRLVEDSVALALADAYVFLNRVKNALEIDRRVPAEAIPPTPEAQEALARRLGYGEHARRRFLEDYRRITRRARQAMERVFYEEET